MPVTGKLSRLFYERLGEQVTNELVEWFNAVDQTYRSDLRELNELNFARFGAKIEQRFAELHADFRTRLAELDAKLEQRSAEVRADFRTRLAELDAKFEQRSAQLDAKLGTKIAELDAKLERRLGEQTRWLIVTWVTVVLGIGGLWFRR